MGGAIGWSIAVIVAIYVVSGIAEPLPRPGRGAGAHAGHVAAGPRRRLRRQLRRHRGRHSDRRGTDVPRGRLFAARPLRPVVAILVTGVTFGLVHGLIEALVVLTAFGIGLAWLRAKTDSVYPCIAVHCAVQRRGAHPRGDRDDMSGLYPRGVRTAIALGIFLALRRSCRRRGRAGVADAARARRDEVRPRRRLHRPALAGPARNAREPHARHDASGRDGHPPQRLVQASRSRSAGRARSTRSRPACPRSRCSCGSSPSSERELVGSTRRRRAAVRARPARARRSRRRARSRRPRRLVRLPRRVPPQRAREARDGSDLAVQRRGRRPAERGLRLRRQADPRRSARTDDRLRLPGTVRPGAARPVARARLRVPFAAHGVRLRRAAGRLRLPEGAAPRADRSSRRSVLAAPCQAGRDRAALQEPRRSHRDRQAAADPHCRPQRPSRR